MAVGYNPRIVTDGLVLALDAGNTKSYSSASASNSNVSLLLHGDGTNGSTTFTDSSINNHTITAHGNAQISTAQSKFGGSSMYFDGYGDYLALPDSSTFATGTDSFTLECWYYPVSKTQNFPRIFQVGTASWVTYDNWTLLDRHNDTGSSKFSCAFFALGGSTMLLTSTTTVQNNTWYHLAVVRDGSTFRLFVNGVEEDTYTNAGAVTVSASTKAWVASAAGASNSTGNGYIDDLRFTKGLARYTSNFTPPTTALPADPATQWTDLSGSNDGTLVNGVGFDSNNLGSFSFDGTDDYVNAPVTKTASCTFSCWAKTTDVSGDRMLFNAGPNGIGPNLYFYNSKIVWNTWDGDSNPFASTPASVTDGNWHYYVVVNDASSNAKLYYDGELLGTATYKNASANTNLTIGGNINTYMWNGSISNFQLHNKGLTASQVLQNYNALKVRYM